MGKLNIRGKEVRTDIIDDDKKAFIVDYVNRKPPSSFPIGIELKFDNSGGLSIGFEDKVWYVGAKMNSAVPKQAISCDSIEEALYKCVSKWNDIKNQTVRMPDVLSESNTVRTMKQTLYRRAKGMLSVFGSTLEKTPKFYKPKSLHDISVTPKNKPTKPSNRQ